MAELEIRRIDGQPAGKLTLDSKLSDSSVSSTTLHRTIVAEEANSRQGTQKTKTRSEARGGGRKPYKQKKTGNARQGSIRSPHYAHGGMALALSPRDYEKKVNRKERRAAILAAFAAQVREGNVSVVETIVFDSPRTKSGYDLLKAMGVEGIRRVLVILGQYDDVTHKCFRNLPNVEVRTAPATGDDMKGGAKTAVFSARDLLVAHRIVIAKDAIDRMQEVWTK